MARPKWIERLWVLPCGARTNHLSTRLLGQAIVLASARSSFARSPLGIDTAAAVQFDVDPEPDYVGCDPAHKTHCRTMPSKVAPIASSHVALTSNNRLEQTVMGQCWRAASARLYVAPASRWMCLRPATKPLFARPRNMKRV